MDDMTLVQSAELAVQGMSCMACAERIKAALANEPGIDSIQVAIGRMRIEYNPYIISLDQIRGIVEGIGYKVPIEGERNPFKRFLIRMAENNEKAFGHERLDCCTMKKK